MVGTFEEARNGSMDGAQLGLGNGVKVENGTIVGLSIACNEGVEV